MSAPDVLLLGATGYLGRHLAAELHRRGRRIRAVVRDARRAENPGAWGAPALSGLIDEQIVGDVRDPGLPDRLTAGVGSVVSALGVTRQGTDPWKIDHDANLGMLRAAERNGVGGFLYVHALGAERCPARLTRAKCAFVAELRSSPVTGMVVSPSGYFSDLAQLLLMARRGRVALTAPGARITPIHGADLAAVCVDHLYQGDGGTREVGGPEELSFREIAELAFKALGTRPRITRLPSRTLDAVALLARPFAPHRADMLRFLAWNMRTDSVAERTGSRRIGEFFAQQAGRIASPPGGNP